MAAPIDLGPILAPALEQQVAAHLAAYGAAWSAQARADAPVGPKPDPRWPARLAASITYTAAGPLDGILALSPKGLWTDSGTRPHPIAPRVAPRLVFWWEREGRWFVGRPGQAVRHPGIARPTHWLSTAATRAGATVPDAALGAAFVQAAFAGMRATNFVP